jgi:hypothetical protein
MSQKPVCVCRSVNVTSEIHLGLSFLFQRGYKAG